MSQNHVRIIHMLVRVVALYRCTTFLCARIRSTRVDFSCCRWKARCKNYLYGELRSVFSSLPSFQHCLCYSFSIACSSISYVITSFIYRFYSFDSFSAYFISIYKAPVSNVLSGFIIIVAWASIFVKSHNKYSNSPSRFVCIYFSSFLLCT